MKLDQIYMRYWVFIPVVFIIALLYPSEINLYVYTDHYQFKLMSIAIGLAIFFFISGFGYYVNRKKTMLENMTQTHRKFTRIGFAASMLSFSYLLFQYGDRVKSPDPSQFSSFSIEQLLALVFILGIFIIFVGFIVYIVNTAITTFYID